MSSMSFLHKLPTLEDILSRKTLPPVCLYNFYIVMRDKFQLDDLLDFYLDVKHHEILWRRYVKAILKEQATVSHMADNVHLGHQNSAFTTAQSMLKNDTSDCNDGFGHRYPFTDDMERSVSTTTIDTSDLHSDSGTTYYSIRDIQNNHRISEGLQYYKYSSPTMEQRQQEEDDRPINKYIDITAPVSDTISVTNLQHLNTTTHLLNKNQITQPVTNTIENNRGSVFQHFLSNDSSSTLSTLKRITDYGNAVSMSKKHRDYAPSLEKLSASTERIVLTYFLDGSEKNLNHILPLHIRRAVVDGYVHPNGKIRIDPMLFADAKHAAYLYMERWAYPSFMRLKVWGNIVDRQQYYRLLLGLICLTVALSMSFSFIFLGTPQWGVRFWTLLPFWFAFYNLLTFAARLDPLLALVFNISETTAFHFNKLAQPQVISILHARSIWLLLFITLLSIILCIIFCVIPPHRL